MKRLLIIPTFLVALLLGSMFWSGTATETRPDFTFINRGEITTLDPARISWLQDIRIAYALWETLYTPDPKTLRPVPGAAVSYTLSDDRRVYTFHLRNEGRWSNADPVTAHDFVFGWRRMLENPDEYTSIFHIIQGAQDYQTAYAADRATASFGGVGIEASDDHTLRVTLIRPVPYFLELVAFTPFVPQHEGSMKRYMTERKLTSLDEGWTHPPFLVGNGPYRLARWDFKRRLRLVANEHYWNDANTKLRTIDMLSAEDPQTAFLKYHSGGVDWLSDVVPGVASELLARNAPDLHVFTGFGTYFYSINCQDTFPDGSPNPFRDVRVRQAFAMALDKQPIVDNVTRMGEHVATQYIPTNIFPGYTSRGGLGFDPERAKQLLADAGYPQGRGFPQVTLMFNTGAHHAEVAQIARRSWLDHLGIDVSLEGMEVQIFRQRLNKKQYMIARASWIGDYNDPTTFVDKYRSTSEGNDAGWLNKAYDALLDQAADEADPAKRFDLIAQAEQMMNDQVPIIPVYYYNNAYLYRDHVRGIAHDPRSMVMFHGVEVVRP